MGISVWNNERKLFKSVVNSICSVLKEEKKIPFCFCLILFLSLFIFFLVQSDDTRLTDVNGT